MTLTLVLKIVTLTAQADDVLGEDLELLADDVKSVVQTGLIGMRLRRALGCGACGLEVLVLEE